MPLREDISLRDLVRATHSLGRKGSRMTHLGVCPMSSELIRAPIELGLEHEFPVLFIASRNQVSEDEGGGYVMGLTPKIFTERIRDTETSLGIDTSSSPDYLRFVGVDHCGPWYRENEKNLDERSAVESVKHTLTACLHAGYCGFHIDCSFKPPEFVKMNETRMAELTVDLIEHTENARIALGKKAVSYEIGTEETAGRSVSSAHFQRSITGILAEIRRRGLPSPAFVVARTGARISMLENAGEFDYTAASSLPEIARKLHTGFKEHNADYLSSPVLSLHPHYGITAANVGPSFAADQTRALLDLADIEEAHVKSNSSRLYAVMSDAVLREAPFWKWLRDEDRWNADELKEMSGELRAVTVACGHYVYDEQQVREARKTLYRNLIRHRLCEDPQGDVMDRVKESIMRYVEAFNLKGSTSKILGQLKNEG